MPRFPRECTDRGWFHIGEFTKSGVSDKYLFLVNRACSQAEYDPTEAPPTIATVRFDPTNLGLGDYVYAIDLATGTDSSDWVGVPETTYTAKMPDGYIPFTTTFRAGEGRLFKIVEAPAPYLEGDINTNLIYQGKMKVTGDVTVDSGETLQIKAPARFEIFRCDSLEEGEDPDRVEIIIDGSLVASSYPDSVLFVPDTTFGCADGLPTNPQPGDWRGIYVDQNAACALSYCAVGFATQGLESRNDARIRLQNCNFHDCSYDGVYCYKSYTSIRQSRFVDNGLAGVDGVDADVDIYGSRFVDNASFGIRLSGTRTGDSTLIEYDTLSCASFPSQHAVSISNIDAARVYKCKARTYTQGGLYLNNSNALVRNNDFSMNTNYGIYADNGSFPRIRQCRLDTLSIGIRTNNSRPNAGTVNPNDPGNCTFLSNGTYYIYHVYKPGYQDTLYAQNNYYGGNPFMNRFYWSSTQSPVKYSPWLANPPAPPRMETPQPLSLAFELRHNYPNPFNPTTTISFTLEAPGHTHLAIYNLLGQRVAWVVDGEVDAGEHAVTWNGRNESGEPVTSGIYFYVLQSGDKVQSQKMTLLR